MGSYVALNTNTRNVFVSMKPQRNPCRYIKSDKSIHPMEQEVNPCN